LPAAAKAVPSTTRTERIGAIETAIKRRNKIADALDQCIRCLFVIAGF
jgi:hypothetical protein